MININNVWKSNNHSKFLLQYHLIFVCKYRHNVLSIKEISGEIKILSNIISNKHNVIIKYMEADKNHIYYLIETIPDINISMFIKTLKSYTTYHIWKNHYNILLHLLVWMRSHHL